MEWISVKDRLPNPNEIVLIHLADKERTATVAGLIYQYDNEVLQKLNGNWATYQGEEIPLDCFVKNEFVTHWMPLPQPPKED